MADAISRLDTIDIYKDHAEAKLQHPLVSKIQPQYSEVTDNVQLLETGITQQLLNITTKTLRRLQKQDRFCKRKVHELKTGTHDEFYLNNENILKRKVTVNNLEGNTIIMPTPLIYTVLHEFQNCKDTRDQPEHLTCKMSILVERYEVRCQKPYQQLYTLFKNPTKHCMSPPAAFRNTKSTFCMPHNRHHW